MVNNKENNHNQLTRNTFVDVLKGICIIFVLITHFSWTGEERLKYFFPYWIDMAVPIFMIISGYVYYFSYKKNGIEEIWDAYRPSFWIQKVIRYTLPFAIMFAIEQIIRLSIGEITLCFKDFLEGSLLFLRGGIGPGSFYFPILIQLVFLYPIIYFIIDRYKSKGLVICGLLNALYEVLQRAYGMNGDFYRLLILRYILVIAVGCYIATGEMKMNIVKALLAFAVGFAFITATEYWGYQPKVIVNWTRTSFLACFYIIPIVAFLFSKFNNSHCKPLEILGKASYNIFLAQMAWYSFGNALIIDGFGMSISSMLADLLICIFLGVLFYFAEISITRNVIAKVNILLGK